MSDSAETTNRGSRQFGFWALIVTQFQGAFNDNAYKLVMIFFLLSHYGALEDQAGAEAKVAAIATTLFALPFLLFPVYAGVLADRLSKRRVSILTKYAEVAIMSLGLVAFWLGSPALGWLTLFLMTTQSAFFSPAKYGLLPELLDEERLSWGNGIIQMTTYIAIISGTAAAGPISDFLGERTWLMSVPLIGLSMAGLVAAHGITREPPANPHQLMHSNPWSGMGRYFKAFGQDRWLMWVVFGIAYFLFAGMVVQQNIIVLGKRALALESDTAISMMQASLALGIGLGSLACGYLSRGRVEPGLIPLGAFGLSLCLLLLAIPLGLYHYALMLLFLLGVFGGFFIVPLNALLQQRSPRDIRGGMIATSNFVSFSGVLVAGIVFYAFGVVGLDAHTVFAIMAVLTAGVGVYICYLLPEFLLRFVLWCLANTFYRLTVMGRHHIPEQGGMLLVANHTSFIDAMVIQATIDRPIRFVMFQDIYDSVWIRPFARAMGAIPISRSAPPREILKSLRTATEAIRAGEVVCIFPEGQITRTGQMLPFKEGFERVMKDVQAPIVPVHLDRLWGSLFSYSGGRFVWKIPRSIPYPITVNYGLPQPHNTPAHEIRSTIMQLGTEAYMQRKLKRPLLHRAFVKTARRHFLRMAIVDNRTPAMSFGKTLIASILFARKLRRLLGEEEMVGVLLPTSVGSALTNVALTFMGKVPVNLNYTASEESRRSAVKQCGIRHIVTAHAFLEKLPMEIPGEPIYLEDVKESVKKSDRIQALLLALFAPARLIERVCGSPGNRSAEDLATIVFSSGSEGEPKGIMLTHYNISSNIESVTQAFPFDYKDRIMGMLPFFHSFGYTVTLWLPLNTHLTAIYHSNPTETRIVAELINKHTATFFIATSTFLQAFIRRCAPEELSSLKYVVCGAEKLAPRVRKAFGTKFGVEPMEGYGTTECSPVVSVNVPDFRSPGFYQKGNKPGTIGHPLPGVSVRTIDPDTGEVLPKGESGILEVKGPNVMKGYLHQPEKTARVLHDGWYATGDIASLDQDGFITITDRLSRFSKIAGEMVPHTSIEEALHNVLGLSEQKMAVTAVPDMSKGERLIVLHTLDDDELDALLASMGDCGLPNLWMPRPTSFYRIDEIPVLGTGKLDIKQVKQMARTIDIGE